MVRLVRGLSADVKGHVVLCDEYGMETCGRAGNIPFNHWDEVPRAMRELISKRRGLRKKWRGKHWEFENSSRAQEPLDNAIVPDYGGPIDISHFGVRPRFSRTGTLLAASNRSNAGQNVLTIL